MALITFHGKHLVVFFTPEEPVEEEENVQLNALLQESLMRYTDANAFMMHLRIP